MSDQARSNPVPKSPSISELLGVEARSLSFVDVTPGTDTAMWIDPFLLMYGSVTPTIANLQSTVVSFFGALSAAVHDDRLLLRLLRNSSEPRFTWLGFAQHGNLGKGLGDLKQQIFGDAARRTITQAMQRSDGPITGMEDLAVLVDGIGKDGISDLITNIVHFSLAAYSMSAIRQFDGRADSAKESITGWSRERQAWVSREVDIIVLNGSRVLLVPKVICAREPLWSTETMLLRLIEVCLSQRGESKTTDALQFLRLSSNSARSLTAKDVLEQLRRNDGGFNPKGVLLELAQHVPHLYKEVKSEAPPSYERRLRKQEVSATRSTPYNLRQE